MIAVVAIFVTGPSSTGKTTLCEALMKRLETSDIDVYHVAEVARTVMREQGFTREHVDTLEMQRAIMVAQIQQEQRIMESIERKGTGGPQGRRPKPSVLLCDRCAVDPVVYATMHLHPDIVSKLTNDARFQGATPYYREKQIIGDHPSGRLVVQPTVILTDGVEEWQGIDDGVRSLYNPWKVAAVFRPVLDNLGIQYQELGENIKRIEERVEWVIDITGLRPFVPSGR